jgi:hypothetical protein
MGLACRMHGKHFKIIGIYTYRPKIKTLWVKFEVLVTLNVNIPVIWDETPWSIQNCTDVSVDHTACTYRVQKGTVHYVKKI